MVFKMRTLSLPKPRTKEDLLVIRGSPLKRFTWRELKLATNNFSTKNIVGRGGSSKVYKGRLADGSLVAIKRCRFETQAGELQFQTEIEMGSSQASDHPNVLRLCGYCITQKERLLVYPFMVNSSVNSRLRDRSPSEPPLDWPTRKRIALGAAKGLAHFHHGCSFTVIFRDMKAANILLDDQFEAVICDFGLIKFVGKNENECHNLNWVQRHVERDDDYDDDTEDKEEDSDDDKFHFTKSCWNLTKTLMLRAEDEDSRGHTKWSCWQFTKNEVISRSGGLDIRGGGVEVGEGVNYHEFCSHVTTAVRGTIGHIAPEYLATGECSVKNDVFGYGVMLLELISGQRAFDLARLANDDDVMLLDWIKGLLVENKLDMMVDSDLMGEYVREEMDQLVELALLCAKEDPRERPTMSEVVKIIENIGQRPRPADHQKLLKKFSLPELLSATQNFGNKNLICRSRFNNVYRGRLSDDGSAIIVKRLVNRRKQGKIQFEAELKLGSIVAGKNPNLLQLRGYCISGKERLLVYPFMVNKSLEWRLRPERSLALDWRARMRIALGVARGVAYLHYECDSNAIIKREVKPSNILLDDDFNPVLCNLRLQSNDKNEVEVSVCSANDVYWYGIILFVLISGNKNNVMDLTPKEVNEPSLHNWYKKMRHLEVDLLVDSRLEMGDSNYDTMNIRNEIEQLLQVVLLCTQPSTKDRPEMWEVIEMIQGISEGDLKVCFAFDRGNLFRFDESLEHELLDEFEVRATMDLPRSDTEGTTTSEFDQEQVIDLKSAHKVDPAQVVANSSHFHATSKGKEVASPPVKATYSSQAQPTKFMSQSKGITISDNVWAPKMEERWKVFLSEVVSNALPTKSKLCRSGMSLDPLCAFCNEYEEDSWHLFFACDFSKQAWQLAIGVRIDMLGFEMVEDVVDAILKPNAVGVNILPSNVEASHFSHKGVALMHSIWTHRNKVCFDKVSPNVMEVVSTSQNHLPVHLN